MDTHKCSMILASLGNNSIKCSVKEILINVAIDIYKIDRLENGWYSFQNKRWQLHQYSIDENISKKDCRKPDKVSLLDEARN